VNKQLHVPAALGSRKSSRDTTGHPQPVMEKQSFSLNPVALLTNVSRYSTYGSQLIQRKKNSLLTSFCFKDKAHWLQRFGINGDKSFGSTTFHQQVGLRVFFRFSSYTKRELLPRDVEDSLASITILAKEYQEIYGKTSIHIKTVQTAYSRI
jgi:hypothetical protein